MVRTVLLTVSLLTTVAMFGFAPQKTSRPNADAAATPTRLSGAVRVIDAGQFPTLQAAFDAIPKSGGMVRIPAGIFEVSAPLLITAEDVCIEGAGTATHIKNTNQEGQPTVILAHPEGPDRKHTLWRIRLANFRITGNPKSGHGVLARQINEIMLDGLTISYHGGDGIRLDHCYEDPRICDCLITYNKATGVHLDGCHDIVVSACQFEENNDALQCLDGFNLTMTGNNLDDHLGRGVVIENTYGSVVSGNMIEECQAAAIVLDRDCYGITLSANVIAHNGAGIDLRDAHGCSVSANTFTLMKTDALRIGPNSGRIAVSGNSFCNSFIGDGQIRRGTEDRAAAGVVLDNTQEIGIVGNTFSSVRPKALEIRGASRRILFSGNVLTDVTTDQPASKTSLVTDNLDAATSP